MCNGRVKTSGDVDVRQSGKQLVLVKEDMSITVPAYTPGAIPVSIVKTIAVDEDLIILLASDSPCSSRLLRVDSDGKKVWEAVVLGANHVNYQGRPRHLVDLGLDSNRDIVVTGGSYSSVYLELFDGTSGRRLTRFLGAADK
ncbi:MAG: hypothetical protein Fues2KO_52170 [Fuerstiella sp.]